MASSHRPTRSAPVRPPQQQRSEQTLAAIVQATERLLRKHRFEEIGIKQVCENAQCTTGAFYARFKSKDELLPLVYERYDRSLRKHAPNNEERARAASMTLPMLTSYVSERLVSTYRRDRWLLRAVATFARQGTPVLNEEQLERRRILHDEIVQLFASHSTQITHADPETATRTALYFAMAICRDRILFAEAPHASLTPLSDTELSDELARMLLRYLSA